MVHQSEYFEWEKTRCRTTKPDAAFTRDQIEGSHGALFCRAGFCRTPMLRAWRSMMAEADMLGKDSHALSVLPLLYQTGSSRCFNPHPEMKDRTGIRSHPLTEWRLTAWVILVGQESPPIWHNRKGKRPLGVWLGRAAHSQLHAGAGQLRSIHMSAENTTCIRL